MQSESETKMRVEPLKQTPRKNFSATTISRYGEKASGLNEVDLAPCMAALRRRAARLAGNRADADDLVQETLKRALTYMSGRADIANVQAYLSTMLNHAYYDQVRQHPSRDTVPLEDATLVSPPAQVERLQCRDILVAVDGLPDDQRQVLILIGLEGHSYKDTALVLNIPIGTVMSRLSRARERLAHLKDKAEANDCNAYAS